MRKASVRRGLQLALPMLLAAAAISIVFYRLETWVQHSESLLLLLGMPWSPIICGVWGVRALRSRDWLRLAACALGFAGCLWAAWTWYHIPFCLVCSGGVTPEELGWMAPYFFGK